MKKYFTLGFFACVLAVSLGFQRVGQTQQAQTERGEMVVSNRVLDENNRSLSITVTLLKGDDVVRSSVLDITSNPGSTTDLNGNAYWKNLPPGSYELHVEADGRGKTIRRIAVAAGEMGKYIIDKVSKKDELMGTRPTFAELDQRLKAVETENAALKARVAALGK